MKAVSIDTQESSNKLRALLDRRMRNATNQSHYTNTQQARMERMKMALELCWRGTVYPVSYGLRGASVKVKKDAILADRRALRLLEADWSQEGVVKKVSAQGTIYYLAR